MRIKPARIITIIALILPFIAILSSQARDLKGQFPTQLLSQLPINIPGVQVDIDVEKKEEQGETPTDASARDENGAEFKGFSGELKTYVDDYNGFQVGIPIEYSLDEKGESTTWVGPILDGAAVGIYVNAASMPNVSPQTLQKTYQQQYEGDRFYTEVELLSIPYGNGKVPALRVKEGNNRRGTRDEKKPDDIHRWHLFVFGNERVYTWGFTGMYQTFKTNKVQKLYESVIDSVKLVPIQE